MSDPMNKGSYDGRPPRWLLHLGNGLNSKVQNPEIVSPQLELAAHVSHPLPINLFILHQFLLNVRQLTKELWQPTQLDVDLHGRGSDEGLQTLPGQVKGVAEDTCVLICPCICVAFPQAFRRKSIPGFTWYM